MNSRYKKFFSQSTCYNIYLCFIIYFIWIWHILYTTQGAKKNNKMVICIKSVNLHKQNHVLNNSLKYISAWVFKTSKNIIKRKLQMELERALCGTEKYLHQAWKYSTGNTSYEGRLQWIGGTYVSKRGNKNMHVTLS